MSATLRQPVAFVVDKVVEEGLRLLFTNALGSNTLPDGTTRLLGPAARDAFAVFEDLCPLETGENLQYLRLESLRMIFAVELIEDMLTNYDKSPRKVRVSFSSCTYRLSSLLLFIKPPKHLLLV